MIAAMRGMTWESPRGPIEIDTRTQDVVLAQPYRTRCPKLRGSRQRERANSIARPRLSGIWGGPTVLEHHFMMGESDS
jgi:hypothetical protein